MYQNAEWLAGSTNCAGVDFYSRVRCQNIRSKSRPQDLRDTHLWRDMGTAACKTNFIA